MWIKAALPNFVTVFRFAVVILAHLFLSDHLTLFVYANLFAFFLDFIDGWLARRWDATGDLGAVLDVVADVFSRQLLWATWSPLASTLVGSLEWWIFSICVTSAEWKMEVLTESSPFILRQVMANNFRTAPGTAAVAGLFGLPLWLSARSRLAACRLRSAFKSTNTFAESFVCGETASVLALLHPAVGGMLLGCRILAMFCEVWITRQYVSMMIRRQRGVVGDGCDKRGVVAKGNKHGNERVRSVVS